MFNTSTFEETYAAYKSLPLEEQQLLRSEALSESSKKWHSEHKEEFSDAMRGHKVSDITKKKISDGNKRYYKNEENRQRASLSQKKCHQEYPRSRESIEKQSASLRKHYEISENRKRASESMKRYFREHPEAKEHLSQKLRKSMSEFYKTDKGIKNLKTFTSASKGKGTSKPEKELQEYVKSLESNVIFNDRNAVHNGMELDIFVPDKMIAIEYNGDIWHSEAFKKDAKTYHLDKTRDCEKLGIRLIHIFSDEWDFKQDIVKSIIASALDHYEKKYMARKLSFRKVSYEEAAAFFEKNHIQGNAQATFYYGLYDNDLLVQCASVSKNRFRKDKESWELVRMASLLNTQVVGGFSRLMKHIMTECNIDEIDSYVDRRLFDSKGYFSSGWTKEGESAPRYFYTNGKIRENRQVYMKQSCLKKWPECTPDMTEHEMCLTHHLYRIYDCGTIKMTFKLLTK